MHLSVGVDVKDRATIASGDDREENIRPLKTTNIDDACVRSQNITPVSFLTHR